MTNKIGNKIVWFGVVEDRMDPLFLGRCRVRIVGIHTDNLIELPTSDLPWAWPLQTIGSAAISGVGNAPVGPVEGTWIACTFLDDWQQQPFMLGAIGGIPVPLDDKAEDIEGFLINDVQGNATSKSNPPPAPSNAVKDSSGEPIKTGSGGYVTTDPAISTPNTIGNLTPEQYSNLKDKIGKVESGGKYDIVEAKNGNYLGKYQMGAEALESAGYIKPGASKRYGTKAVQDPSNWTGKDGVTSKDSYLKNPTAQESAMDSNLKTNFKATGLSNSIPADKQAGVLMASHLVGAGGAKKLLNGDNPKDANGTTAASYFQKGASVVTGKSSNEVPKAANLAKPAIDTNVENTSLSDKGKFDPDNMPEVIKKLKTKASEKIGFTDPNEKYPKEEWLKEPDTHRLARHQSIDKTIVPTKEEERDKEIPIANAEDTWDQSLIPYNAKYPFNHIFESESGHTIEIDDTEGMERIHIYHKTGTFIEIDSEGTLTRRVKGNEVTISENDNKTHIMGTGILTVDGDFAVEIHKSLQIFVSGDAQIKVEGNVIQEIDGNYDSHVKGNMTVQCDGDYNLKVSGNSIEETEGDFDQKVGGDTSEEAGGNYTIQAGPLYAVDAGQVHNNSGKATGASGAEDAAPIEVFEPDLKVLDPTTRQSASDFEMEDAAEEDKVKYIEEKKLSGNSPKEAPMPENEKKKDTAPAPNIDQYKSNPNSETLKPPFTKDTQLSTNFKLGDLCPKGLPPEGGQAGLTQAQIVQNLKDTSINVLEPMKEKYPDLKVNSGFREGAGTSQHHKGQAVDLSYGAANASTNKKSMMQDFASDIKNSTAHDQIILETAGGNSAWVHVSNNPQGNRPNSDPTKHMTMDTSTGKKTSGLGFA